jgi:thiol-disulfide isomerase/thioredoxin
MLVAGTIVTLLAGLTGVYGIGGFQRNAEAAQSCAATVEKASRLAPLARGEVAAVTIATKPLRVPSLAFEDAQGQRHTIEDWRGRTVLLNLWATWCVPCRKEMPALDALEGKLGGPAFNVVAVNIDTRNLEKPKAWLNEVGVTRLSYYSDSNAKIFQDLRAVGRAFGMPTTMLIDPEGCELGTIAGPAEWASGDALKLIQAAIDNN